MATIPSHNTRPIPQSFEHRTFFPKFRDIPGEMTYRDPSQHWCLLGEIIEANTMIRPRIVAKDYTGQQFVVALYPEDDSYREYMNKRLLPKFKVGYTILIMGAFAHGFLDGSRGVRVEETDEALIIPLSLQETFNMSNEVVKYTPSDASIERKCHGCDEAKEKLSKCAKCGLFYYCGQDCQRKGWMDKKHKGYCAALKDRNLRWVLFLDFAHSRGSLSFS